MKLNGWQRLWVVVSAIWLLAVAGIALTEQQRAPEAVRRTLESQVRSAASYEAYLLAYDELTQEQHFELESVREKGAAAQRKLRAMSEGKSVPELREWRLKSLSLHVVIGFGTSLVLYMAGLVVAWVARGFAARN